MIDNRIKTFLKLCDLMNYRKTAQVLNMTQPAVTQHIKFLENEYNCKLFNYDGRKLSITDSGILLKKYAQAVKHNNDELKQKLKKPQKTQLKIGATKTIGDYVIADNIINLLKTEEINLSLIVDNTKNLLSMLNNSQIDFALIEGFFDKNSYGHRLLKQEKFVGICAKNHPFASKEVDFKDIFSQTIIYREKGSGTREVFEQILYENSYNLDCFSNSMCINSFELIKKLVINNLGISFVYEAVAKSDKDISIFKIKDRQIIREFNYVFLKNTFSENLIDLL